MAKGDRKTVGVYHFISEGLQPFNPNRRWNTRGGGHASFNVYVPSGSLTNCSNFPQGSQDRAKCEAANSITSQWGNINPGMQNWFATTSHPNSPQPIAPYEPGLWQQAFNIHFGLSARLPTQPESLNDWINLARVKLLETGKDSSVLAPDFQALAQIIESVGQNEISEERGIELTKQIAVRSGQITREDIENLDNTKEKELFEKMEINLQILLDQLILQNNNGFELANTIQLETNLTQKQNFKDGLSNLIIDTIPRTINNINEMMRSFSSNRFEISPDQLTLIDTEKKRFRELLILAGGVIDESEGLKVLAGFQIDKIRRIII